MQKPSQSELAATQSQDTQSVVVDSERKDFIDPQTGFEQLPGFIPESLTDDFSAEVSRLELAAADPFTSKWWKPNPYEHEPVTPLRNEYHRTVAGAMYENPDFASEFPLLDDAINRLKQRNGFTKLNTLNINRYRPGSQIPHHTDPESSAPFRIYSLGVEGNGIFRIWPDVTSVGYVPGNLAETTAIEMGRGDVVGLQSIRSEYSDDEPYRKFLLDSEPVQGELSEYVCREHSAENPFEEDRVIALIGLS